MPDFGGAVPPAAVSGADFERYADKVRNPGLLGKLAGGLVFALFEDPRLLAAFFRRFAPIAHIRVFKPNPPQRGFWLVTRYDDVMEVLERNQDFPVPFDKPMRQLDRTGENFILGMPNDDTYKAIHRETMKAFRLEDVPSIAKFAYQRADTALAAAHKNRIDAIGGLLTLVPTEIVGRYYGIPVQDPNFAILLIGMNLHSFPHLVTIPAAEPAALAAAARIGPLVDAAIARAKAAAPDPNPATILGRFVKAQQDDPKSVMTDDVIRSTIMGCMLGFIPTNNRASGQILRYLLKRPDVMERAIDAARSGDDDLLQRVLMEALRFRPINPGPFRLVAQDTVIASGQPRERKVPKDAMLMVATHSASFDPREVEDPNTFSDHRELSDTMRFGWGQHFCIGYKIAVEQIAQTFKPLLERGPFRAVRGPLGKAKYYGGFYEHLHIEFGLESRS